MRACVLTDGLEHESEALRGWQRALDADARRLEELDPETAYDLVLVPVSARSLRSMPALREQGAAVLALWVEERVAADLEEWFRRAAEVADVVFCSQFQLSSELRARLGVVAVELTPPWFPEPPNAFLRGANVRPRRLRPSTAIVGTRRSAWSELGITAYVATMLRCRVEFHLPSDAPEQIADHDFVYMVEPLLDGGALAAHCAESGALLLAPRSYHPARFCYPFTSYGPEPGRAGGLLLWLFSSSDLAASFREHAAHRARQLSDGDRRLQLARAVQQIFPTIECPADPARPSLLEQIRHVSGPRDFRYEADECALVCLVRNGGEHLESFLEHHRALGVRHFVFIDNDSDDGSRTLLEALPDATVYETSLPHKHYENELRRLIIERHCQRRWCLSVDIDELFDYPESSRLSLAGLLGYLRNQGATAMVGYLLDMFAHENVFGEARAVDLKSEYPFYDTSDVEKVPYLAEEVATFCDGNLLEDPRLSCYFGGIRRRVFGGGRAEFLLTKHPLFLVDGQLQPCVHPHYVNRARVADVTSVLYHYKLTPSFKAKVSESVAVGRYVELAQRQYDDYQRRIGARGSLVIETPGRRRLHSVDQLVDEGFLQSSPAYRDYVEEHSAARMARAWSTQIGARHG